jgi:hypothetical protein
MQEQAAIATEQPVGWRLWSSWVLISLAAGVISSLVTLAVCSPNGYLFYGFVIGPILGALQSLLIQRRLPGLTLGGWGFTTTVGSWAGWIVGFWLLGSLLTPYAQRGLIAFRSYGANVLVGEPLDPLEVLGFTMGCGAILGLMIGLAQKSISNEVEHLPGRMDPARVWVLGNIGAWALALPCMFFVVRPLFGWESDPTATPMNSLVAWTATVTLAGAITGLALLHLLNVPVAASSGTQR